MIHCYHSTSKLNNTHPLVPALSNSNGQLGQPRACNPLRSCVKREGYNQFEDEVATEGVPEPAAAPTPTPVVAIQTVVVATRQLPLPASNASR
jgi:hypothetical protein